MEARCALMPLVLALGACTAPRIAEDAALPSAPTLRAAFDRMPSPSAGRIRVLPDNVDSWVTRWRAIEGARQSIDVQSFIVESDAFGLSLLGLLREKREAGLDVRLMVDSRGTPDLTRAFAGLHVLAELAAGGAEVRAYNNLESHLGDVAVVGIRHAVASNHDKLVIVDHRTAILGGRNIAADYLSDPRDLPGAYIDMDVVIEGETAANALTRAFVAELHTDNARNIKAARSDDDRDALVLATALMRRWMNEPHFNEEQIEALRDPEARDTLALALEGKLIGQLDHIPSDGVRALLRKLTQELASLPRLRGALTRPPRAVDRTTDAVHILDTLSAAAPPMRDQITENILIAIGTARREVVLQSPYLILSERGVATLEAAARRGVVITFLTNSPMSSDNPMTQVAFLEQWPKVMARLPRARLYVIGIPRLMHAKVILVDGVLSFVGSYNLDPMSAHVNGEIVSAVWGEQFSAELRGTITRRVDRGAPEVVEYTIARNAAGVPLLDTDGDPVVTFGPADHADPASLAAVAAQKSAAVLLAPLL